MDSAHNPVAAEQVLEGDPVEGEEEALVVQSTTAINPLDLPPDQFQESLERRKANRKSLIDWVREALVDGVDFGRIHFVKKSTCSLGKNCTIDGHFAKPSLFKPGAEKILGMLGITVNWPTLNQYEQVALDGRKIESIVLRCEAITASGEVAAEGMGARSVAQDGGDLNKALKMAKKCLGGRTPVLIKTSRGIVRTNIHRMYMSQGELAKGTMYIAGPNASWKKVVGMKKYAAAKVYRITLQNGFTFAASPDHLWPTIDSLEKESAELSVGDTLMQSSLPSGKDTVSIEIGWAVGFYLAEGDMRANTSMTRFTISSKEVAYANKLSELSRNMGSTFADKIDGNKRTISIYGDAFKGIIKQFTNGKGSGGKRLSTFSWRQGDQFLKAVLLGYLAGDGHYSNRPGRNPFWVICFTRKNTELANDIRTICSILGWRCKISYGYETCKGKRFPTYRGWIKFTKPKYNGRDLGGIVKISQSVQPTYDIEVGGDHLFCLANGIVTHNSGMIDMTLTLGGLSEIFTQDIEDMVRKSPQEQYPDLPSTLQDHPQAAPRFDRDSKLGFGKHKDKTWKDKDVDKGYLTYIAKGDGDHALFADLELKARKEAPDLAPLIANVHKGLDAISGSAASGILDEWLGEYGLERVEDGSERALGALLEILRKEFRVENPKAEGTQIEIPPGG